MDLITPLPLDGTRMVTVFHLVSGWDHSPLTRSCLNISQSLTLEHSRILDAGVYDTLLTIDPYTHFGCPNNYYTFVASTVGVNASFLLKQNFSSSTMVCYLSGTLLYTAVFICTFSVAEYPLLTVYPNIEWYKRECCLSLFCYWRVPSHHQHLTPQEW